MPNYSVFIIINNLYYSVYNIHFRILKIIVLTGDSNARIQNTKYGFTFVHPDLINTTPENGNVLINTHIRHV